MADEKHYIGRIDVCDIREVEPLIERLAGLEELLLVDIDGELKQKIVLEVDEIKKQKRQWWIRSIAKYNWDCDSDSEWEIDFETGELWINT